MTHVKIDLVSDIACPWCAIGYARLQQAITQLPESITVDLEWHAFELNPDPDLKPEPILPALSRKYGRSEAEMQQAQAQMTEVATGLGLNFNKMQTRYTTNTFDAHRLVKWARQFDKQTAMKQALFDAYFGDALNVADHDVLLNCVEHIGLNREEAARILSSDDFKVDVRDDEQRYQQAGVSAVPAFILADKYLISGAQEPETLAQAIQQVAREIS